MITENRIREAFKTASEELGYVDIEGSSDAPKAVTGNKRLERLACKAITNWISVEDHSTGEIKIYFPLWILILVSEKLNVYSDKQIYSTPIYRKEYLDMAILNEKQIEELEEHEDFYRDTEHNKFYYHSSIIGAEEKEYWICIYMGVKSLYRKNVINYDYPIILPLPHCTIFTKSCGKCKYYSSNSLIGCAVQPVHFEWCVKNYISAAKGCADYDPKH